MAATVGSAAPVEPATTMEAASTVKAATSARRTEAVESTAPAKGSAAAESAVIAEPAATVISWSTAIESRAASVESTPAIESMEPRTRAYKYAPVKVVGAVVTVWRARVRWIAIVTVGACRRRTDVTWRDIAWPNSNSNSKPDLGVGSSRPRNRY